MKNRAEFELLISENRGIIFKVIRLYEEREEEVKDLYQEVLLQTWKSFHLYKGKSKFGTWLYRVTLNTVLTHRRKEDRRTLTRPFNESEEFTEEADRNERKEALWGAIRCLNELDRALISLHFDGYDYSEIGEVLGLQASNVGVRLHRIKKNLKKIMKP
ncbi:sigma-70 family RNA polymerase sigma factor [Cryomorphaceae bacterium]|nr:sigma-70 family RNA polymerase sigma factor [Cryomorphaceae bacterium]